MIDRRAIRRCTCLVRCGAVAAFLTAASTGCGDDLPGRTAELSIHFRQLPNGGLAAVGTHGLHICQNEPDVDRIHVTVDSIPPDNTTQGHEFFWTCEELSHD